MEFLKKSLLILTASLIIFSIAACEEKKAVNVKPFDSDFTKSEGRKSDSKTRKKDKYLVGMAQCNFAEPWRVVMNEQINIAAAQHPEIDFKIYDGMQDNSKQISDTESFLEKNYDLIVISPNEAKPLTAVVRKVFESGIPVILMDRKIEGEYYTQFIGADNELIGQKAGEWAAKSLGEKGGNIVEIRGSEGTSAQKERRKGFAKGIAKNPKAKIIDSQNADWLRENAIRVMEQILPANNKIDIVYGHNDPCAEGAYMAAKNAGREKDIKFIGIDALPTPDGGIKSVMDGRLSVTYVYPSGGKEVIDSCYKLLVKGEKLEKTIVLDTIEVTKDNAVEIYKQFGGK